MAKKILKFSFLSVMLLMASVFCVLSINHNKISEVNAETVVAEVVEVYTDVDTTLEPNKRFKMGEVTGYGDYPVGTEATLVATPVDGCVFLYWQDESGVKLSEDNPYTFVVEANKKVNAVFGFVSYKVEERFNNFSLGAINGIVMDSSRFGVSNIASFPRPNVDPAGKYYYNDEIDITYNLDENKYSKSFDSTDFVISGKDVIMIVTDSASNILYTEVKGVKDESLKAQNLDSYTDYDLDSYDYVICENTSVGDNSITSAIRVKTKVNKDLEFKIVDEAKKNLQLLTISAKLELPTEPITYETLTVETLLGPDAESGLKTIDFKYGFYGRINSDLYPSLSDDYLHYLVAQDTQYKIVLTNNKFYSFKQLESGSSSLEGMFGDSVRDIILIYTETIYILNFSQIIKMGSNYENVLENENWANITSMYPAGIMAYAGDSVKVKYDAGKFVISIQGKNESEFTVKNTITPNTNIYGFSFFGFSDTNSLDITNTEITKQFDASNPEDFNLYIVLTKLEYTIQFGLADVEGNYDPYFSYKASNLPDGSIKYTRRDKINLSAKIPYGVEQKGWIKVQNGVLNVDPNYTFIPTSNDPELQILLKVDYLYTNYTFTTRGDKDGTTVGEIQTVILKSFVLEPDESKITAKALKYVSGSASEITFEFEKFGEGIYTSNVGDVYLNGSKNVLSFKGKEYVLNSSGEYVTGGRASDFDYGFERPQDYCITIAKISVDDYVFSVTNVKSDMSEEYRFLQFVNKATNISLDKSTKEIAGTEYNYHLNSYSAEVEVYADYANHKEQAYVSTGNAHAYDVGNIKIAGTDIEILYTPGVDTNKTIKVSGTSEVYLYVIKNSITTGYSFAGVHIDFYGREDINYSTSDSGMKLDDTFNGQPAYRFKFTFTTDHIVSNILIMFAEIDYTVNFDFNGTNYPEDPSFVRDANIDVSVGGVTISTASNVVLNWSTIRQNPNLTVSSSTGYYISKIYFKEDIEANWLVDLFGVDNKATAKSMPIDVVMFENIMALSEAENVSLFITEDRRLFSINVTYKANYGTVEHAKLAEIKCSYAGAEDSIKHAEDRIGKNGKEYGLTFEKIKHLTEVTLTIDDSMLEGLYFTSWDILGVTNASNEMNLSQTFAIGGDIEIQINFTAIEYVHQINYLPVEIDSGLSILVDGLSANYHFVGSKLDYIITEKTGYQIDEVFYYKNGEKQKLNIYDDGEKLYHTIESFVPSNYLDADRTGQIASIEARTIVLHVVFKEKLYTITTEVVNKTRSSKVLGKKYVNTTSLEPADWIDNVEVLYFNGTEYVKQEADPEGNISYKTGSKIKISFVNSLVGLNLEDIYLGSDDFTVTESTTSVGGTDVSFIKIQDGKKDSFVLEFILNSNILDTCRAGSNQFNILLNYKIKGYTLTFSSNTINNKLLSKDYELKLSYAPDKALQAYLPNARDNFSGVLQIETNVANSNLFYGSGATLSINNEKNVASFNEKYRFAYFYFMEGETKVKFGVNNDIDGERKASYQFELDGTYPIDPQDPAGDTFNLWERMGDNQKLEIYAYYEPWIQFGKDMIYDRDNNMYKKSVLYNGKIQKLSTSKEVGVEADLIYAHEDIGVLTISYSLVGSGTNIDPINAGVYDVKIIIDGNEFSIPINLIINKVKLTLTHTGGIEKVYDGTPDLTSLNVASLKEQLALTGVLECDDHLQKLDLSYMAGYYTQSKVGEDINVSLIQIRLANPLLTNYYIVEGTSQQIDVELKGIAKINKYQLSVAVNSFVFENIVYKPDQDYTLKYVKVETLSFLQELFGVDECFIDESKMHFELSEYSVGYDRVVTVHLAGTLAGADSENYFINNLYYKINIHPYQLEYTMENVGTWTITDFDEGCFIPIELDNKSFTVDNITSTHPLYSSLYSEIDDILAREEQIYAFYRFNLTTGYGNAVPLSDLAGAYITFQAPKKMSATYEMTEEITKLNTEKIDGVVKIKIEDSSADCYAVVIHKSYFAIWRIVLIIGLCLLLLLLIILAVIIYKKLRQKKAEKRDKIY